MSPSTYRIAVTAAIIVGIVAVALFFSFARQPLIAILAEVRDRLARARASVLQRTARFWTDRTSSFWVDRGREPRAPVVAELNRLNDSVTFIGQQQCEGLALTQEKMAAHVEVFKSLATGNSAEATAEGQPLAKAMDAPSLFGLGFLILFSLAIGGVNSFLLGIFFREVIGSYRLLPYPLPDIQAGHVIAVIMFLAEIGSGWAIFRSGVRAQQRPESATSGAAFFRFIPWAMLFVLAIVEFAAYATLSVKVDLPSRLKMDTNGPLYGLAEYFLAFLGLGLTMLLSYLGHAMTEGIHERRRSKLARDLAKALRTSREGALERAGKMRSLIEDVTTAAAAFPQSISAEFRRSLGAEETKASVIQTIERVTTSLTTIRADNRSDVGNGWYEMRSVSQAWSDIVIGALLFLAGDIIAAFTTFEVLTFMLRSGGPTGAFGAWAAAIGVPLSIVGLAVLLWNVVRGLRYASPATAAFPETRGQRMLSYALMGGLAIATIVLVTLAVTLTPASPVLFGFLALLQAAALIGLGAVVDRGAVALSYLVYLATLALVRAAGLLLGAAATLVSLIFYAIIVMIRLIAVPGDLLRGRRVTAIQTAA